jgi:hypothetical protein
MMHGTTTTIITITIIPYNINTAYVNMKVKPVTKEANGTI